MKRNLIVSIIAFALALSWTIYRVHSVNSQALTTKSDLISLFRADATDLLKVRARIRAHRASFDALGLTFSDGDFTGANAGITATQFTSAVTNLTDVCDKFDLGGSLPVGIPTNVNRIANVNIANLGASSVSGVDQIISTGIGTN